MMHILHLHTVCISVSGIILKHTDLPGDKKNNQICGQITFLFKSSDQISHSINTVTEDNAVDPGVDRWGKQWVFM